MRAGVGWPEDLIGLRRPAPPSSTNGRTLAKECPVIVDDYTAEPPFPGKALYDSDGMRLSVGIAIAEAEGP